MMYNVEIKEEKIIRWKKKIRYVASYRGTGEMDQIMRGFIDRHLDQMTEGQLCCFAEIIQLPDEVIMNNISRHLPKIHSIEDMDALFWEMIKNA